MNARRTPGPLHTLTPWVVEDLDILGAPGGIAHVATANRGIGFAEADANAAFIVEACNAHDGLKESFQLAMETINKANADVDRYAAQWRATKQENERLREAAQRLVDTNSLPRCGCDIYAGGDETWGTECPPCALRAALGKAVEG